MYDVRPISGTLMHQMKQYVIDGKKMILLKELEPDQQKVGACGCCGGSACFLFCGWICVPFASTREMSCICVRCRFLCGAIPALHLVGSQCAERVTHASHCSSLTDTRCHIIHAGGGMHVRDRRGVRH
jgi:hypothetical protein